MNIKQAKQIPIQMLVAKFGGREASQKGGEIWFFSPFRPEERTPSFKVNLKLNTWYDFGFGKGGSNIDFLIDLNNWDRKDSQAVKRALEIIGSYSAEEVNESTLPTVSYSSSVEADDKPRFSLIRKPSKIWMDSLCVEIAHRGIPLNVANKHLRQVYFQDEKTKRNYNGLGMQNSEGGWEVSVPNPYSNTNFKTAIGKKSSTLKIHPHSDEVCVFEGFWDYLSFLAINGKIEPTNSVVVLHSLSFIRPACENMLQWSRKPKRIFLYLDNDSAGEKGRDIFFDVFDNQDVEVIVQNHLYDGFKDLNEMWIDKSLKKKLEIPDRQGLGQMPRIMSNKL